MERWQQGQRRRGHGGIIGLVRLIDDHGEALEYDLITRTTYTLDDIGGPLPWRALLAFVRHLPPDSALMADMGERQSQEALWTSHRMVPVLLAQLLDAINYLRYEEGARASGRKGKKPKPTRTPWSKDDDSVQTLGSEPIRIADFDDWWDGNEQKEV